MDNFDKLLNEFYELTVKEQKRPLKNEELDRYVELVDKLRENNIEIPFGVLI